MLTEGVLCLTAAIAWIKHYQTIAKTIRLIIRSTILCEEHSCGTVTVNFRYMSYQVFWLVYLQPFVPTSMHSK